MLARSAFHHSLNYESVVIFGNAKLGADSEKEQVLKVISDHLLPGRWEEVRGPNDVELKATKVLKIDLEECSAKVRAGDPIDDNEDYDLNIWAGIVPINKTFGNPISDSKLKNGIELSRSVKRIKN